MASAKKKKQVDTKPAATERPTRRSFLRKVWIGLGVVALAESVGLAVAFLRPWKPKPGADAFGGVINAGMIEQFEPGSVTPFRRGQFYLVRLEDGGFLALSRKCTHLGCTVNWQVRPAAVRLPLPRLGLRRHRRRAHRAGPPAAGYLPDHHRKPDDQGGHGKTAPPQPQRPVPGHPGLKRDDERRQNTSHAQPRGWTEPSRRRWELCRPRRHAGHRPRLPALSGEAAALARRRLGDSSSSPRPASWAGRAAAPATNPSATPWTARTTTWPWTWPPTRPCSATSTTPRSPRHGVTSRFYRRDGKFFVRDRGPGRASWASSRSPTSSATIRCSSTWCRFPGGRLQCLTVAWDSKRRRSGSTSTPTRTHPAGRLAALDPRRPELERDVRRVPLDESARRATTRRPTATTRPGRTSTSAARPATAPARGTSPGPSCRPWPGPPAPNYELVVRTSGIDARRAGGALRPLPLPPRRARRLRPHRDRACSTAMLPPAAVARASTTPTVRSSTRSTSTARSCRARCTPATSAAATATTSHSLKLHHEGNELCLQCHQAEVYDTATTTSTRRSTRASRATARCA